MYLGNLTVRCVEKRLGIEITDSERQELEAMRQDYADGIAADKWHGFDIPFVIACGSTQVAQRIAEILSPYGKEMKRAIRIGVVTNDE